MNNKEIIKYKENFILKIKKFFKNIFSKNYQQSPNIQIDQKVNQQKIIKKENSFFNDIKIDTTEIDKFARKRALIEKVDGNREEFRKLSIDELAELEEYYDKIIMQNNEMIKKLNTKKPWN